MFTQTFPRHVAGQAMQIDRGQDGLELTLRILRQHARNDSGENVSRPASRHSGIAGRIHPGFSVRLCDDGAIAFEDQNQLVLPCKRSRNV